MLNKICLADGVGLVNIVRSQAQENALRALGAVHVCDSTSPAFMQELTSALTATDATLAFDAIGGGPLAGQILTCMEVAANRNATAYSRYGSTTHKQVYVYGRLDLRPIELGGGYGMAWGVGGWLLWPFLQKIGTAAAQALRERVVAELKTTFASHYAGSVSLAEALQPDAIAAYGRRATGEKFLITPQKGL
jgi:NADPH:quinone reductase-like Zn-dependent oxidoreductase